MKQRGFLSLEMWLIIGGVIAVMAAVALYSRWMYNLGANAKEAEYKEATAKEKLVRQETISKLALDLGKAGEDLYKERQQTKAKDETIREQRKGLLHAYVPRDTVCIRAGFVRYTNAAAAGVPLDAGLGTGLAQAPSGIGTDDVADVIARNYDKYNDCKRTVGDILKDFDAKRSTFNKAVNGINQRVKEQQ